MDARDNTATTGTGVAIYWLDGAKVADDYADFYDGDWGSTVVKDENGSNDGTLGIWTGSAENGMASSNPAGSSDVTYGWPNAGSVFSFGTLANDEERSLYGLSPVFKVVDQSAPTVQTVPQDWALIPDGLGAGDQFRLLFVTSGTRNAQSSDIADYNTFVQNAANGSGVDDVIKGMSGEFRAVVSTASTAARDNTATHPNAAIPIYWLDGAKVADDYAGFYDGGWDSTEARDEDGDTFATNPGAWTGSENDGTAAGQRALGASSTSRFGNVGTTPLSHGNATNDGSRSIYALSPVLTVVDQVGTVPHDWPLIPSGLGGGDQFRLLFITSLSRSAASANIGDYNAFVQGHAGGGHEAIRPYRNKFRALASTAAVDANDNAALTGTGVAIYALSVDASGNFNGVKLDDDYEDFCTSGWDNAPNGDESGSDSSASFVWTGSGSDCEEVGSNGLGRTNVRVGLATTAVNALNRVGVNQASSNLLPLYGLSPVFTVEVTDYDSDDDGLIEVSTLAQLNAIRWDPDGDGAGDRRRCDDRR